MLDKNHPIYTLSVEQFSNLFRELLSEKSTASNQELNPTANADDDMMTVETLSAFLHCSPATIFNHRKRGLLPQPYQVGRKVVWKKSDVVKFLATPINKRKKAA